MKFRCERDVLVEALSVAERATTGRNATLPVLNGVRLEVAGDRLSVTGTDLDLRISTSVTVAGDTDGLAVLPAKLAADIVRSLEPGAVTVEAGEEEARISSGRSQFSVRLFPPEDFPRAAESSGQTVEIPGGVLVEALRQVVRAASRDDGVPIITGVLLAAEDGGLRLVATDKYRLAVRDLPGTSVLTEGQHVLVPARALSELERLVRAASRGKEESALNVSLRLGENEVTFEVGPARLTSRLIPGDFPPYRKLIPSGYPNKLIIGKEPLLEALRRVRLLVKDQVTSVRIALKPEQITLTVTTADVGTATEDIDANYEGSEMVVAFNPDFLAQGVEAISSDEVLLEATDPIRQVTLKPVGTDGSPVGHYMYLIMPVRVQQA